MAQYNSFDIKLSNSHLNKLKSGIKIGSDFKSFIKCGWWF